MIFVFEDNADADTSNLFRVSYPDGMRTEKSSFIKSTADKCLQWVEYVYDDKRFAYSKGNTNIPLLVEELHRDLSVEQENTLIVVFLDMVPGNRYIQDTYKLRIDI